MLKLKIALRYIFSRKSHSVINLLSIVSVVAVAIPVAASVLVVSLHNGLSDAIFGMYSDFDADIKIEPTVGETFDPSVFVAKDFDFVAADTKILEQGVVLSDDQGRQSVAVFKGVDSNFRQVVNIDKLITHGEFELKLGDLDQVVVGQGLAYNMGINPALMSPISIYGISSLPMVVLPIFNVEDAFPVAVFVLDKSVDQSYMFGSIDQARRLFGKTDMVSAIDVKIDPKTDLNSAAKSIQNALGEDFKVKTRSQQRDALFKIVNIEKWITMLLLGVIVFIAALSLVGSIVIMVAEKTKQNLTLMQLGYQESDIRKIYTNLGVVIAILGLVVGLVLGLTLSWVQMNWGILTIGEGNFIVNAYPIKIVFWDIFTIFGVVITITAAITYVTTKTVRVIPAES